MKEDKGLIQQTDTEIRRVIQKVMDEKIKRAANSSVSPNNMSPRKQTSKKYAIEIDGDKTNDKCPKCPKNVNTVVQCNSCNSWLHFGYEKVKQSQIKKAYKGKDYKCTACTKLEESSNSSISESRGQIKARRLTRVTLTVSR